MKREEHYRDSPKHPYRAKHCFILQAREENSCEVSKQKTHLSGMPRYCKIISPGKSGTTTSQTPNLPSRLESNEFRATEGFPQPWEQFASIDTAAD